jgi:anti-sigma-K factor RskA
MRAPPDELIDDVIAEYVLGTLSGPARRRCERWLADACMLERRRRFWEEHLIYLAQPHGCLGPPEHVWVSIRRRLNLPQG